MINHHGGSVRRGRLIAGLLATSALAISGLAATGGPAQSADPTGDCTAAFPVADLAQGDLVNGKTVVSGVTPTDFSGEVLGVLDSGIAPGLDMIIVRLDMPEFARTGGIWQGMSGSPVYAEDGRLIGAVSYGLSWGASPVAGVTPFEDMDDYLGATPVARVRVGDAMAKTIAQNSDVTRTQAGEGFRQLPMPVSASGISQSRLAMGKHGRHYLRDLKTAQAGGASASFGSGSPSDIIAGGNLAAGLSYGDVTMAGVGTATSVCDGRVVGFGHPMTFQGKTTLGLMPADAIYVQEDSLGSPFKVANVGMPAGTITDDHLTGITGTFGDMPPETDVTAQADYNGRDRTGESFGLVQESLADLFFTQNIGNADRVIDGIHAGSADRTYSATGTDAQGQPFTVNLDNLYQSDYDISGDSIWREADLTWFLSGMDGVTVDSIDTTASYSDDSTVWTIKKLAVKAGGSWVTVGRRDTLKVRPGQTLHMRGDLASTTGTTELPFTVQVPTNPKGLYGVISLVGGSDFYPRGLYKAQTPQELNAALADAPRNDQAIGQLEIFSRRKSQVGSTTTTDPFGTVIRGGKYVQIKIKF
jgi:hypothetical protein